MEIEDAEVISEGPKPPPPPPRAAKLEPAGAESFGVFDGPVKDAPNATAKPDEGRKKARQAAKDKRGGGKRPSTPPAAAAAAAGPGQVDPELLRQLRAKRKAQQLLKLYEMYQLSQVREAFRDLLTPASLEELCRRNAFGPAELELMAEPLAQGLLENQVELPWWVDFGVFFGTAVMMRRQALGELELKLRGEKPAANSNTEPTSPPAPPKAA